MKRLFTFLVCMCRISPVVWNNVHRDRDFRCVLGFHEYRNALWYGTDKICVRCHEPPTPPAR